MPLPALRLLLGPDAAGFLGAALAGYGADLTSMRVVDARVAPTGGVRVQYHCGVRRADGSVAGELLVAATGDGIPAGATVLTGVVAGDHMKVGMWRWPQDPVLPGLAAATHPEHLAARMNSAGLVVTAGLRISPRSYRPGQRAVLEVTDGCSRWFVKVVPPKAVDGLVVRHALLGAVLPVPPALVADEDGVVVLPAASGTLMRQVMADEGTEPGDLPGPSALEEVLDALPVNLVDLPVRPRHLQRVRQSLQVLTLTTGEKYDDFDSLSTASDSDRVPVHGDFHDAQLLVGRGRVTAVIDVDTAGPGERADEWANLLGHLSVRGVACARARDYGAELLAHAERRVDGRDLRMRTAAVVLGLANGPFRAQRPGWRARTSSRVELARYWLHSMREPSSPAPTLLM